MTKEPNVKKQNQTILSRLPLSRSFAPTTAQPQVQIFNLSDALAEFRRRLEADADAPLQDVETSAAFVLNDLCAFLGFGETLRAKILGPDATAFVDRFLDEGVELAR
jgi:hypothetical protein